MRNPEFICSFDLHSFVSKAIVPLRHKELERHSIEADVLRLDLVHPQISGNKWLKLRYNLQEAYRQDSRRLLTFGGAYSNHIYAVAAAGQLLDIETIAVVRGERTEPLNATLRFAESTGMHLYFVDRSTYRCKHELWFLEKLKQQFGDFYLIPEGGSNSWGVRGCMELMGEWSHSYDYVLLPCGTGGTLAGVALGLAAHQRVVGVAVLKGGQFLYERVAALQSTLGYEPTSNLEIWTEYAHRGYARSSPALDAFMAEWASWQSIPIEHVYSAKLFYAFWQALQNNYFVAGCRVLLIHTGGLRSAGNTPCNLPADTILS